MIDTGEAENAPRILEALKEKNVDHLDALIISHFDKDHVGGAAQILENIRTYHREQGAAIVLVSHSMDEVAREAERLVVFHDAAIPFSGTPAEVFSHGEELEAIGLGVPAMTRLFTRLRAMGVDVPAGVYTVEQARDAILTRLGKGAV